nr:diguanylate cyclase [Gammaproteobacteria bacterium]
MPSTPRSTGALRPTAPKRGVARGSDAEDTAAGPSALAGLPSLPSAEGPVALPGPTADSALAARALAAEARYQAIFESATWGIFQTTPEGRYLAANPALARIYGYRSAADLQAGLTDIARELYVDPARRRQFIEQMERFGTVSDFESEVYRRDGSRIWITESVRAVRDAGGRLLFYEGFVEDVTARKLAEERLRASEERYALAAAGSNDGLWDWDLLGRRVYFSPRWKAMLGYADDEVGDSPDDWLTRVHPDEHGRVVSTLASHLTGDSAHFQCEFRIRTQDGGYRWMLARGLAVRSAGGVAYRMAGSLTDVTERRLAEERLQFDAFHDALTGLPNRALFLDRLERALLQVTRDPSQRVAVLFIDLDRFKLVNDSLGHPLGDELLQETAHRLQSCVRPSDTVARLGGDEFVLLVGSLKHADDAIRVAERVHASLSDPFLVAGREIHVTASIGVVMNDGRYRSPVDLLRDADIAMYQAKARGRAGHVVFQSELHGRAKELLTLEGDLRRAL